MSDLPPAPGVDPNLLPPEPSRRQFRRAMLKGLGVGALLHTCWFGLGLNYLYLYYAALDRAERTDLAYGPGLQTLLAGLVTSVVLLLASIVLLATPRTRAFGTGFTMAWALGTFVGAGVCVGMASVG